MMKRSMSLVAALALSSASGLALAADEKMPQTGAPSGYETGAESSGAGGSAGSSAGSSSSAMPSFSQADSDGNGVIDQNEAGAVTGLDMSSADSNSDGQLSRTEYEAATMRQGSSGSSSGSSGGSGSSQ